MQNYQTTKLNDRKYHAAVQQVEDDTAVIIGGKVAAENLTL